MHGAIAENRSVYDIHEDRPGWRTSTELPKVGAYFINVGRGSLVDEIALIEALDSGHLSGATLDVFSTEPLPADHPMWRHPKITMTPHIAGGRPTTAIEATVENYRRVKLGKALLNLAMA